ncbi:hypothetical protein JX265_011436 [Neoarthrinium moseri]|uniref:Cytochrome P450 n=1 Tax=Neoarthrinium moseri TaxID=1658444 RepID=A0A9P9WCK4_9PEZI|nr:hypothetical protein JX265_011436 [Neoarthrinium moseri]
MDISDVIAPAFLYVSLLVILYGILLLSYRILLHPLKAYPGLFLARLSDIHNGYYVMRKSLHLVSRSYHQKYGKVIRHGPNKLLFNTPKALHDIYNNDMVVKSYVYSVFIQTPGVHSLFTVVDKQHHTAKRRIVGQVINDRSMKMFEPSMAGQIDIYLKLLSESSKRPDPKPVNMTQMFEYLACDIVGLLAFGYHLNLQTEATNRFMLQGMYSANHWTNLRMHFFILHQLGLIRIIRRLNGSILVSKANAETTSQDDRIHMSEIWSEGISFFPAGAFSTSGALSALFFYLSQSPSCYKRLATEIRSAFAASHEIRGGPKLADCQYLRACIDEALRIAPPVPGTMWREPAANNSKPLIIDGHYIPPGTQIGVNIYAIHHNPEYFQDPFTFKPERWLSETPEAQRKSMQDAFSAFSVGYRGCAGKAMAYLESSLVVAKTLWYFDFERAPGKLGEVGGGRPGSHNGRSRLDEFQLYDIISGAHDGPFLIFTSRGDSSASERR